MDFRSLTPLGGTQPGRTRAESDPFAHFRRNLDRLVEDAFGGRELARWPGAPSAAVDLRMDVSETDKEIKVRAELPGVEEKDVEVMLADDILTIKGEKRVEEERKEENHHIVERSYGGFARSLRLPPGIDPGQVSAAFERGVLTVTLPKPAAVQERTRKIEIKKG